MRLPLLLTYLVELILWRSTAKPYEFRDLVYWNNTHLFSSGYPIGFAWGRYAKFEVYRNDRFADVIRTRDVLVNRYPFDFMYPDDPTFSIRAAFLNETDKKMVKALDLVSPTVRSALYKDFYAEHFRSALNFLLCNELRNISFTYGPGKTPVRVTSKALFDYHKRCPNACLFPLSADGENRMVKELGYRELQCKTMWVKNEICEPAGEMGAMHVTDFRCNCYSQLAKWSSNLKSCVFDMGYLDKKSDKCHMTNTLTVDYVGFIDGELITNIFKPFAHASQCKCQPTATGEYCEQPRDPCLEQVNYITGYTMCNVRFGGECKSVLGSYSYRCNCGPHYEELPIAIGVHKQRANCLKRKNPCRDFLCAHGVCYIQEVFDAALGYNVPRARCHCQMGYTGDRCKQRMTYMADTIWGTWSACQPPCTREDDDQPRVRIRKLICLDELAYCKHRNQSFQMRVCRPRPCDRFMRLLVALQADDNEATRTAASPVLGILVVMMTMGLLFIGFLVFLKAMASLNHGYQGLKARYSMVDNID